MRLHRRTIQATLIVHSNTGHRILKLTTHIKDDLDISNMKMYKFLLMQPSPT
jgi:hypothetical protein